MNRPQAWQSGYDLCDTTGQQCCLLLGDCSLENRLLGKYCGTCNGRCTVPYDSTYGVDDALTPTHPRLPDILAEVGGLAINSRGLPVATGSLPSFVPLVTTNRRSLPGYSPICAVSPSVLFRAVRRGGSMRFYPQDDVRRLVGLAPDAPLMLTGNARDDILQWWWEHADEAATAIAHNRFDYVMSPDFSVYGNRCPLEWAYNLKRRFLGMEQLHSCTSDPVVTLSLPNAFFRARLADWLVANPQVNCVGLNTQMMKPDTEFAAGVRAAAQLRADVGRPLHFLVTGPSKPFRMNLVWETLGAATIVSSFLFNANR